MSINVHNVIMWLIIVLYQWTQLYNYIALTAPGDAPQSFNADSLALGTINISWSPPPTELHYGVITGYQIDYGIAGNNLTNSTFTADLNITLTGLSSDTAYEIVIAAVNGAGVSSFDASLIIATIAPRKFCVIFMCHC